MTREQLRLEIANLLEELETVRGSYGIKSDAVLFAIEEKIPEFDDLFFKE